ncbi:GTPase of the mitochondrial inner membrane that associates with the large ribosomal subunit [Mactra antiquata]
MVLQRFVYKFGTSSVVCAIIRRYSAYPIKPKKPKAEGDTKKFFVDFKKVRVIGGKGGDGCISFRREAKVEFGGPDGGNGGHGGHVIFTGTQNESSLSSVQTVLKASSGIIGKSSNRHGKDAEHLYTEVPLGTIIRDQNGNELTSLDGEREYYIAACGGAGGKGNQHFVSSEDTTPRYAEEGAYGEDRTLYLELKTMAHIGLIGFPNAGKSTLLRAISCARPKVAPYAFTTLHPHVGIVEYDDYERVIVADIPGLIPDAHKNRGLGVSFLRHIERCLCLLYVIDLSIEEPWTQLEHLKYELEQYKPGLSERPHAIIGNKMDLEISRKNYIEMKSRTNLKIIPISAENRQNLKQLLVEMRDMYDIESVTTEYG